MIVLVRILVGRLGFCIKKNEKRISGFFVIGDLNGW